MTLIFYVGLLDTNSSYSEVLGVIYESQVGNRVKNL